jgi:hypothetical protein
MHDDRKAGDDRNRYGTSGRGAALGLVLAAATLACGSNEDSGGAGTGGSSGSGGSGECSTVLYVPCNGACLRVGETENGCTALSDSFAYGLAVDDSNLYFAGSQTINTLDLDSLDEAALVEDLALPSEVVLGGSTLYFLTSFTEPAVSDDMNAGTLRSVATSGGTASILAQGLDVPQRLVLIDETLFLGAGILSGFNVHRIPITGGTLERIFYQNVTAFAIDGSDAYFTVPLGDDDLNPKLHRAVIGDALSETAVADLGAEVDWLFVDATHVYFAGMGYPVTTPTEYVYGRVAKSDGTTETLATRALPFRVKVVDGEDIYLLEEPGDDAALLRMPLAGGDTQSLMTFSGSDNSPVAVDASYVYVGSTNGILRMEK